MHSSIVYLICIKSLLPSLHSDTCRLPKVVGPCRGAFPRWFYNTSSGRCEQFIFGGCGGNANNFNSSASCLRNCGKKLGNFYNLQKSKEYRIPPPPPLSPPPPPPADPSVLQCPPNDTVNCFVDPCQVASCPNYPRATCISDFCRGCNARFFDTNGNEVTATCCEPINTPLCILSFNHHVILAHTHIVSEMDTSVWNKHRAPFVPIMNGCAWAYRRKNV